MIDHDNYLFQELTLYLTRYPEVEIDPYRINFEQFEDLEEGYALGKTKPLKSKTAKTFVRFVKNGRYTYLLKIEIELLLFYLLILTCKCIYNFMPFIGSNALKILLKKDISQEF